MKAKTQSISARTGALSSYRDPWFWVATAFIVLVFFMGGSSRATVLSLPFLRPVAAMVLAASLLFIRRDELAAHRGLVGLLLAAMAAVLVQLLPLPPGLWSHLPHRDLAVAAARSAGIGDAWRPLTLSPSGTRNAAFSLLIPTAMLGLGLCLNPAARRQLLWVVLGLGGFAVVLGVLQLTTSPSPAFYFYRLSTQFVPTGFFANPNHNAAFMAALLPLVSHAASNLRGRIGIVPKELIVDIVAILVIGLTILLAGSRAGLFLAAIGVAAMPLSRRLRLELRSRANLPIVAGIMIGVLVIGVIATLLGRAAALHRMLAGGAIGDLRLRVWPIIWRETVSYFPAGAGWGSFVEAFQIAEPYSLLKPTYLNHAHNDWLEVAMDGGVIGVTLLIAIAGWWFWHLAATLRASRRPAMAWAGLAICLILGLSSLVDYPLRTPCLQTLLVLSAFWIRDATRVDLAGFRPREGLAADTPTIGMS